MEYIKAKAGEARGGDDRGALTLRLIVAFGDDLKIFELRLPDVSEDHYRRAVVHGSDCIVRELRAMESLVRGG